MALIGRQWLSVRARLRRWSLPPPDSYNTCGRRLVGESSYFHFDEVFHGPVAFGPRQILKAKLRSVISVLRVTHFLRNSHAIDFHG